VYDWGGETVTVAEPARPGAATFELSARDILLFRRHPGPTSARNLFPCTVAELHERGNRTGVALECRGGRLVAEVMRETAVELGLAPGDPLFAAVKASAFRRIL
jgi:molybdate transport system ATP-binding protein